MSFDGPLASDGQLHDAAVIGGGLAGCAVLRALTLAGLSCVLLEPGEHLIDPWSAPHAYALQAVLNGASILRRAEVRGARREAGGWTLDTAAGTVRAGLVVNCAGNFGDRVEALHRDSPFAIR